MRTLPPLTRLVLVVLNLFMETTMNSGGNLYTGILTGENLIILGTHGNRLW